MKKNSLGTPAHTILETTLEHVTKLLEQQDTPRKPSEQTDSRLEQNIIFTIWRHEASLDWIIKKHATGKVRPRTKRVLLWALAEFLHLNGAPRHAVTDAAIHFVKTKHAASEAGFVNAVLRKISTQMEEGEDLLAGAPPHIKLELSQELWQRWRKVYGPKKTAEIAKRMLVPGTLIFRRQLWPACQTLTPPELLPLPAFPWFPEAQFFTPSQRIDNLEKFMARNPDLYIQDPATLMAPSLLAPRPGESVADLCAAPGGKTRIMAELMEDKGKLRAQDKTEDKLKRLRENLKAFSCCAIGTGDATAPTLPPESLDALLLDVPCTNTGVMRHKPDAKWTFSTKKLNELTLIQKNILDAAAPLVRHGGRIVYSTCSIEPEENMEQVQDFLLRHPEFELTKQEQLLPDDHHDGAFAALLIRK